MQNKYLLAIVGTLVVIGCLVFIVGLNKEDEIAETKDTEEGSTQTSSDGDEAPVVEALNEFIEQDTSKTVERSEGGLTLLIRGPGVLKVGQKKSYILNVFNSTYQSRPKSPYEFHQKTATFLTAGPITLSNKTGDYGPNVLQRERTYDDFNETQVFYVTCNAVGEATVTFQTKGTSGATTPEIKYSITIDFPLTCVEEEDDSSSNSESVSVEEAGNKQVYKLGEEYPDAEKQFAVVFTIDGLPYAQGQFQYADPEDPGTGCPFYHIHSNVTVYPFQQWFIRGDIDLGLQTNAGLALTDPAPDKCGFGWDVTLGPKSVFVPKPHFVEMCSRFDLDNVGTAENFDTRRTPELKEFCANLGN